MGRSRITRTFHNKPVSKSSNKTGSNTRTKGSNIRNPTIKASPTQVKSKNKGIIPQAHAQESSPPKAKIVLSKPKKVTSRRLVSTSVSQPKSTWISGYQTTRVLPENFQSSSGYVSQEKAEEQIEKEGWNNFEFRTTHRSKPHGRNITYRRTDRVESPSDTNFKPTTIYSKYTDLDTEIYRSGMPNTNPKRTILGSVTGGPGKERTILGKFAQGVSNEAQDMVGIPHGFVTGNNYKPKSVLSRATEHAFAGDWDSAGKVISDNPYRFAGNIATTVGTGFIPFGAVTRGAGLAAKVGSAVTKGKSKIAGKLKGKGAEKKSYAGGRYTNKEINDTERLVQQSEWMGWGKVQNPSKSKGIGKRQTGLGFSSISKKRGAVSRYKNRKEQRFIDDEQAMERRIDDFTQSPSTGTPKWYQPREQFLAKTKGSRARLSSDRERAQIIGSERRYNARIADNYENTKPTKNSFWQNQVTKDGDDVSGWVDPDDFYRFR